MTTLTPLEEMRKLKQYDLAQTIRETKEGYLKITTAGHGYLFVPFTDPHADMAKKVSSQYSFVGTLGYYLEEDCEAYEFLQAIK